MSRFAGTDQRVYLKVSRHQVEGILKVGSKNLFHRDGAGRCHEMAPTCILDFYVHESVQRKGVGKSLFQKMLDSEKVQPHKLAYDRPSPKLLGFLKKHYRLTDYIPQNNNFVVFNDYFQPAVN